MQVDGKSRHILPANDVEAGSVRTSGAHSCSCIRYFCCGSSFRSLCCLRIRSMTCAHLRAGASTQEYDERPGGGFRSRRTRGHQQSRGNDKEVLVSHNLRERRKTSSLTSLLLFSRCAMVRSTFATFVAILQHIITYLVKECFNCGHTRLE